MIRKRKEYKESYKEYYSFNDYNILGSVKITAYCKQSFKVAESLDMYGSEDLMERWCVTWLKNGKRYIQYAAHKHTAEYVARERAKQAARSNFEIMTPKKYREKFGSENAIVVQSP